MLPPTPPIVLKVAQTRQQVAQLKMRRERSRQKCQTKSLADSPRRGKTSEDLDDCRSQFNKSTKGDRGNDDRRTLMLGLLRMNLQERSVQPPGVGQFGEFVMEKWRGRLTSPLKHDRQLFLGVRRLKRLLEDTKDC